MKKRQLNYVCQECGRREPRWLGRCPGCGAWNSFLQEQAPDPREREVDSAPRRTPLPLNQIDITPQRRVSTGIGELDRALGGGLVPGSVVLLGGEPGIGKSTLTLQLLDQLRDEGPLLLVSAEESAAQVRLRALRIGVSRKDLYILEESRLARIEAALRDRPPRCVVIDSVQALRALEDGEAPGTVSQVRYAAFELSEWARASGSPLWLIAHVTKSGLIAGPKLIEHLVDTVLLFEEAEGGVRLLRAVKNRFGSVDELGLFRMEERGLVEVNDPEELFLQRRLASPPPGSAIAVVIEGSRVLLVEVQVLTVPAKAGLGRVTSDRIDSTRVARVAAVIERHLGLTFSDHDIYINVAGGLRLSEPAVDLPLALALLSARMQKPLPQGLASAGELSLAGEIRPIPHQRRRWRAALDLGMHLYLSPGEEVGEGWETVATLAQAAQRVVGWVSPRAD